MVPVVTGVLASGLLLLFYLGALAFVSGQEQALAQLGDSWPWVAGLAAGFGAQVGLYVRLRALVRHGRRPGQVLAATGGTSGAAMISCCAHYVANVAPILGASGIVTLVGQYQAEIMWLGLVFNAAGTGYIARRLRQASRHMALMQG